jgi:integrase
MYATAIGPDIVDLVTLLMASGLRLGEALSLRWTDLDLESGTLEVKGTVLRVGDRTHYCVLTEVGGWPSDPRASDVGRRYASRALRVPCR